MKKLVTLLLCTVLLLTASGCNSQKLETLGKCPVEMQTVTQKDAQAQLNITYTFPIPKDWHVIQASGYVVAVTPSNITNTLELHDDLSLGLGIRKYTVNQSKEQIQEYKDLFVGKYETYEEAIVANAQKSNGSISNFQLKLYKGTHGRIAEIRFICTFKDHPETVWDSIYCFREDIPYFVSGGFDSSKAFSSGEVVPWVADSLQIDDKNAQ